MTTSRVPPSTVPSPWLGWLLAALGLGPLLGSYLFEVTPRDPLVLGATPLLLLAAATLAAWLPARRAARVDPLDALRLEG